MIDIQHDRTTLVLPTVGLDIINISGGNSGALCFEA